MQRLQDGRFYFIMSPEQQVTTPTVHFARKEISNMPYDPNYPYGSGYNPYGGYQPRQTNTYAFVNGIEGAKSFIVQPNQTVLLMDSEQPVCYMKQANGLGQGTLRYFKLQEVTENEIRGASAQPQANVEYATKEDIKNVLQRLEKLEGGKNE